jgi:hypothetical protein
VRLGPSTPGDYVCARVLVPPKPGCDIAQPKTKKSMHSCRATSEPRESPLTPATPKKIFLISEDLLPNEEARLLSCLNRNKDVFAWFALDLVGVSCTIIEHSLGIDSSVRPRKQRLRKMSDEKIEDAKAEVHRLLEAKFIEPIAYPNHQGPCRWRPCSRPRSIKQIPSANEGMTRQHC